MEKLMRIFFVTLLFSTLSYSTYADQFIDGAEGKSFDCAQKTSQAEIISCLNEVPVVEHCLKDNEGGEFCFVQDRDEFGANTYITTSANYEVLKNFDVIYYNINFQIIDKESYSLLKPLQKAVITSYSMCCEKNAQDPGRCRDAVVGGGLTGAVAGATGGASAGGAIAGPPGAAAGAMAGMIAGGIGGALAARGTADACKPAKPGSGSQRGML